MIEVVLSAGPQSILGVNNLASRLESGDIVGDEDRRRGAMVDVDTCENEGGDLRTKIGTLPAAAGFFSGRRDSPKSHRASTARLLSEWRMSWLARLVGIGLLSLVLLVIFGAFTPR